MPEHGTADHPNSVAIRVYLFGILFSWVVARSIKQVHYEVRALEIRLRNQKNLESRCRAAVPMAEVVPLPVGPHVRPRECAPGCVHGRARAELARAAYRPLNIDTEEMAR